MTFFWREEQEGALTDVRGRMSYTAAAAAGGVNVTVSELHGVNGVGVSPSCLSSWSDYAPWCFVTTSAPTKGVYSWIGFRFTVRVRVIRVKTTILGG